MATLSELASLFRFGRNRAEVATAAGFQTAAGPNVLQSSSGNAAGLDLHNVPGLSGQHFQAFSLILQGNSAITAGTVIIQGSYDGVAFFNLEYTATTNPASFLAGNIGITSGQNLTVRVDNTFGCRYVTCMINTAFTGATPGVRARNLVLEPVTLGEQIKRVFVTGTIGTVSTVTQVTAAGLNATGVITDATSAAVTTTTNFGPVTPGASVAQSFTLNVTAVSGTNPLMVVDVQESMDGGTLWQTIHTFKVNSVSLNVSPVYNTRGNRIRYVQTVSGTTPSFTRTISRSQHQSAPAPLLGAGGHQSFSLNYDSQFVHGTTATLHPANSYTVGDTATVGSSFTVPAGKRLIVTGLQAAGFSQSFLTANSGAFSSGWFCLAVAAPGTTISTGSPRLGITTYATALAAPSVANTIAMPFECKQQFENGTLQVAAGCTIQLVSQASVSSMGACFASVTGYLVNA